MDDVLDEAGSEEIEVVTFGEATEEPVDVITFEDDDEEVWETWTIEDPEPEEPLRGDGTPARKTITDGHQGPNFSRFKDQY